MSDKQEVKKDIIRKKFSGEVIGSQNDKTIVVKVERVKQHPKYKKRYTVSRKYQVHDPKNEHKVGDKVVFVECRPLSKSKKWRVLAS